MIAILAGNHQQFREYIWENKGDIKNFKYIDGTYPLVGYIFDGYEVIGTFWEDKKNASEIFDEVKMRTVPLTLLTANEDK